MISKSLILAIAIAGLMLCAIAQAQYHAYPTPISEKIYIDPSAFADALLNEAQSKDGSFQLHINYDRAAYSELNEYLMGSTNDTIKMHYYERFHSQQLVDWILAQPDNSVLPHDVFREAVRIRQGDVLSAVVTVHETLRNYARGLAPYTQQKIGLAKRNLVYDKFVDIRGDLAERDPHRLKGDHYGSWYRVWALMSRQMVKGHKGPLQNKVWLVRNFFSGMLAELVKALPIYHMWGYRFGDPRKMEINVVGAKTGFYLVQRLSVVGGISGGETPSYLKRELSAPICRRVFE